MKTQFASTIYKVSLAIQDTPPVDQLKHYLRLGYAELRPHLYHCKNNNDVLEVISDNCSLIDIKLLESVVDQFHIESAKPTIEQYKNAIKSFCEETIHTILNRWLSSTPSSLQSETLTFTICRHVNNYTLNDVECFIGSAFEEQSHKIRVIVIRESNSFIVKCSFPVTYSEKLIQLALRNIEVLREKGMSSMKIGYCTIYNSELQVCIQVYVVTMIIFVY